MTWQRFVKFSGDGKVTLRGLQQRGLPAHKHNVTMIELIYTKPKKGEQDSPVLDVDKYRL